MATSSQAGIVIANIRRDLQEKKYCDFELICKGEKIPVHRVVVCPQSSVLAAVEGPSFLISSASPEITKHVVEYLYTGDFTCPDTRTQPDGAGGDETQHTATRKRKLSNAAESPKRLDSRHSSSQMSRIFELAVQLGIPTLITKATMFFQRYIIGSRGPLRFLRGVPFLYSIRDEGAASVLRRACVEATRSSFGPMMAVGGENRRILDSVLEKTPEFAKDLLESCILDDTSSSVIKSPQ